MRFSIIVPVYNTEQYLPECVNSVLSQTCPDWEMIIVDDGSTDQSGVLADKFAGRDNRIHVIHKQNGGQFWAREDGARQAQGEYLLFLDSDDYWEDSCLQILNDAVEEYTPDIVMFAAERFGDDSRSNNIIGRFSEQAEWCAKQHAYQLLISGNSCNSLCLKAVKRSLFMGDATDYSAFAGIGIGEDKVRLLHPVTQADKILMLPEALYHYRYHSSSVMHSMDVDKIPHMIAGKMFELLYSYMKTWGMDDETGREKLAVYYLRQFLQTYFSVKKSCVSKEEKRRFRRYPWRKNLDRRALKYAFSGQLQWKEKIGLALVCLPKVATE